MQNIKILLIQLREEEIMRNHEYTCFLKFGKLEHKNFKKINIFTDKLSLDLLEEIDAIIIGGSGEHLLSSGNLKKYLIDLDKITLKAIDKNIPILGSCLGMQYLGELLGGKVEKLEDKVESGSILITKTNQANEDILFKNLPSQFYAQVGHKDHITILPKNAINLAYSDKCISHAFKIGNNVYGTQFHLELDIEGVIFRLKHYSNEGYFKDENELNQIISELKESKEVNDLVERFIFEIVIKKNAK